MATPQQKAFCVLRFNKCESAITVQRDFRRTYGTEAPTAQSIRRWHQTFQESGCLCAQKRSGRPRTSDENIERVRQSFVQSPQKSTRRAGLELDLPHSTVWRVLRRRLTLKAYRIQLLQALLPDDKQKRIDFCNFISEKQEENESFVSRIVFSDEATFHLSGKVNRHNVRIWALEQPHATVEHQRDSPKINVFCAISRKKVYGPFFFEENTVTGNTYLNMLQTWLFPQLQVDSDEFVFQQDGAPPHWKLEVRRYLNGELPQRWIGRKGNDDLAIHPWPPRSPDLTVCDFFLWGYIKDKVYVPPLPTNLEELKIRIKDAVNAVTPDLISNVWEEFDYRIDVCRAAGGGHIEHL